MTRGADFIVNLIIITDPVARPNVRQNYKNYLLFD